MALSDYEVLVRAGHTPAKATEIALDAQRGDDFCLKWIASIRRQDEIERVGRKVRSDRRD